MPLKQVITIIILAVILGTGAEYFFIIRNGGDPFADIARLTGGSVAYALIVALVLLVMDAAIFLRSRLARNNAGGNHCRYDPLSSGDLNLPHEVGQTAAHVRREYASIFGRPTALKQTGIKRSVVQSLIRIGPTHYDHVENAAVAPDEVLTRWRIV